jgi:hypothetical protein
MMILDFGTSRQRARNMPGGVNPSYSQANISAILRLGALPLAAT